MALTLLLPLLTFLLLCLALAGSEGGEGNSDPDWLAVVLQAALLWGALLALLSAWLSLLRALDWLGVSLAWGAAAGGLAAWGRRSGRTGRGWARVKAAAAGLRRAAALPRLQALWLAVVALLALVSLVVALQAPPNTNDSMRYHMARVMHWLQNGSLSHYNTPVDAQLYNPPWAELAILHLMLLAGGDRLANLPQWLAMLGSLAGAAWLAKRLGAGMPGQVFAVVFAFTIPMGVLQSTSTQNDYVTAFWTTCLAVFTLRDLAGKPSAWMMGLSAALGVLTKGSFYPYAIALLGGWGLVRLAALAQGGVPVQQRWLEARRILIYAAVVMGCVAVLNGFFWLENLRTYGSPVGPAGAVRQHTNQSFTPAALASNLIRNTTLHLGTPWGEVNGRVKSLVELLHGWMGQDVNDPATSLDEYRVRRYLTEDRAGNPWHFLAVPGLAALAWLGRRGKPRPAQAERKSIKWAGWYGLLVLAIFVLYSLLYKWQDTGSRLQLPWFVLLAPLAGALWERMPWLNVGKVSVRALLPLLFLALSLRFVFVNPSRPFIASGEITRTIWNTARPDQVFGNFPEVRHAYEALVGTLVATGCTEVGLRLDSSDPEYYLWALVEAADYKAHFEHLYPEPPVAAAGLADFTPCAVICTYCTEDVKDGLPLRYVNAEGARLYARAGGE